MPDASTHDDLLLFWTRLTHGFCAGQTLVSVLSAIAEELEGTPTAKVVEAIRRVRDSTEADPAPC